MQMSLPFYSFDRPDDQEALAATFRKKLDEWNTKYPNGFDRSLSRICADCGERKKSPYGEVCQKCKGKRMENKPNANHWSMKMKNPTTMPPVDFSKYTYREKKSTSPNYFDQMPSEKAHAKRDRVPSRFP